MANTQVSQAAVLVLGTPPAANTVLSQAVIQVLYKEGANSLLSQAAVLVLGRRRGRRIFTQVDAGYNK